MIMNNNPHTLSFAALDFNGGNMINYLHASFPNGSHIMVQPAFKTAPDAQVLCHGIAVPSTIIKRGS
jgi:hypothetical protein